MFTKTNIAFKVVFSITLFLSLFQIEAAYSAMQIKFMVRDVQVQKKGSNSWQKAQIRQLLNPGDSVKTGVSSFADLSSGSQRIRMRANSRIKISQGMVSGQPQESVALFVGNIYMKVQKKKKGDTTNIVTPSTVCSVRGTEFEVAAAANGQTLLQVAEGTVNLSGEQKDINVSENQESSVPLGGDPSKIRILQKRDWQKWRRQMRQEIGTNQENLLQTCLLKMKKLQGEIQVLEKNWEKNQALKTEYRQKALEYKKQGNREKVREYGKKSFEAGRLAYVSKAKSYYKADKMQLIKELGDQIYQGSTDRSELSKNTYQKINLLYGPYLEKYILEIQKERKGK